MSKHSHLVIREMVSGKEVSIQEYATQKIQSIPGGRYRVVDKDTGEFVEDVGVGLEGDDLVVYVKESGTVLRLLGFNDGSQGFVADVYGSEGQAYEQAITAEQLSALELGSGDAMTAAYNDGSRESDRDNRVAPFGPPPGLTMPMLFASAMVAQIIWSSKSKGHGHFHEGSGGHSGPVEVSLDEPYLKSGKVTEEEAQRTGIRFTGAAKNADGALVELLVNGVPVPGAVGRMEGNSWAITLSPSQLQSLGLKQGDAFQVQAAVKNDLGENLVLSKPLYVPVGDIDGSGVQPPQPPHPSELSLKIVSVAGDSKVDAGELRDGFDVVADVKGAKGPVNLTVTVARPGSAPVSVDVTAHFDASAGHYIAHLDAGAIAKLNLTQGETVSVSASAKVAGQDLRDTFGDVVVEGGSVPPQPTVEILNVAGNDNVLDSKEYADGFAMTLRASHAKVTKGTKVTLNFGGQDVTLYPQADADSDGRFEVKLSKADIDRAQIASGKKGQARVTVDGVGTAAADYDWQDAGGAPQPSLKIVSVAGDSKVDSGELRDGFDVVADVKGAKGPVNLTVTVARPGFAPVSVDVPAHFDASAGHYIAHLDAGAIAKLNLTQGETVSVSASARVAGQDLSDTFGDVVVEGGSAPKPRSVKILSVAGDDNVLDSKEYADGFAMTLRASNAKVTKGTKVTLNFGGQNVTLYPQADADSDGRFEVKLSKEDIDRAQIASGKKGQARVTVEGVGTATADYDWQDAGGAPQGKLSIVSVGGDDNKVDNGEFLKPIEIVLKADNIKGIQAGQKIRIAVGGKTAEVAAEGAPDPQTGLFKASLSPEQASGASNSLGLSMGKSYSMTASMKVADVDYSTTGEKNFEVLAQGKLSIVSVGGDDNMVDNGEFLKPIEIVLKAEHIEGIQAGRKIRITVGGKTAEVAAEGAPDPQTGLFKALLGPDQAHGASNSLGLSMGKSYSMTASMKVADFEYTTADEKGFEVLPQDEQGELSIVSVGGSDDKVDNGEFVKPIEIVLKADKIKGIQAGQKIQLAVEGKTAEVVAEGSPDPQNGQFKALLSPDQAHGASNSLGLSMGKSYSMTASMKVAGVDYKTTDAKSFEILPQDQTSDPLKIISVAGDNILDEKEYQNGFEIVYKVNDPSYNSKDDKVRVTINDRDFQLQPTQITKDSEGNYVAKIEKYQIRYNNIECGKEASVEVNIETNSKTLTAESKLTAHAPQVAIVSVGGDDNKVDNKEFEKPIEIFLQKNGSQIDGEKVSLNINGNEFVLKAETYSWEKSVVHINPKEAGLTQGKSYTITTKTNGVVSEEYPFEVLSGPFGRDVGDGSGKSTLFDSNKLIVYHDNKLIDHPSEWIFYDLKKLGGLTQDGKIVFKVNGTEVGSLDVKAGVNNGHGQLDEKVGQNIINALKEDQVSLILAEYIDSQGTPIRTVDARPVLLNAKPGEDRTLLESTNKDGHLKDDLVTIDDISANEIERQYRRYGKVKFHGNAKDLIDSDGHGSVSDIVVVIGKNAYRPKPKNGKWELELEYKDLDSADLGLKPFDTTYHLNPENKHYNIPIQVYALNSEGKALGYAQSSIIKDTQPKIILDPISENNIITNNEINGTIEVTGRIKNASGLEYHIYMDNYNESNGGEVLGVGQNRFRRVFSDDESIKVRLDPNEMKGMKDFKESFLRIDLGDPNYRGYDPYSTITMKFNDHLVLDYMKNERGVTDPNEIDKLVSATRGDNSNDSFWSKREFYEQDGYSILDVPRFPKEGDPKFESIDQVRMSYANIKNVANSLSVINSIRQMNGLDPVKLSRDFQTIEQTQKAVISMANEGKISHNIAEDNFKYTDQDAIDGAKTSLLGKTTQIDVVMGYVSDDNSVVRTTGSTAADKMNIDHRIALLDPHLKELAPAFAAGQDGFIYSGFGLKYDQPTGGASKQPETLEWPPAGVSWYSMMPKTTWSFHCNADQFHLRKVTVYRARDGQNPEKLEVDQPALQDVGTDSPYKHVLTFNPHEKNWSYDDDQHMWIDTLKNEKHKRGIAQVYDSKKDHFSEYTVIIDTDEKVYTYKSTVWDTRDPSPYPSTWGLGLEKLTEDQLREMYETQNSHSQYLGKSEIEKELMDELREHSENLHDVANAGDKPLSNNSQSHENAAVAGSLNQEVHAKPGHIDPLVASDIHHPTHYLSPITSSVDLGNGDDEITVAKISGGSIDGGRGFDTVHFAQGGNELNLINFSNVEVIDLGYFENDNSFNALTITAEGMKQNGGSIELKGNAGHKIVLKEGVIESDQTSIDDFGGIRHELQYNVNGNQFRIVMNDDLYNGGASIL